MKNIWKPDDIEAGLYIIRESSPKGNKDLNFARTVTFKIGYGHFGKIGRDSKEYKTTQEYCLISHMTDGFCSPIAHSKKDLAEHLNKDIHGYRPLTKNEFCNMLMHVNQGFY